MSIKQLNKTPEGMKRGFWCLVATIYPEKIRTNLYKDDGEGNPEYNPQSNEHLNENCVNEYVIGYTENESIASNAYHELLLFVKTECIHGRDAAILIQYITQRLITVPLVEKPLAIRSNSDGPL